MLNSTKLLYILPDLAYVAELLPSKKPHDFSIQSFRQINGEFIDDNQFISANILKLTAKLDEGEYHLILPDYLFTNTIVSVKETEDAQIAHYLQSVLLPQLNINTNSHDVDTTVLTTFKNQASVQLSALEKDLLAPLRVGLKYSKAKIIAISPMSWSIKSLVSLEPSITVLQVGRMIYSALHYIGVDQTNQTTIAEIDNIAETIKTLKGVEANIQTVYLLTDDLVENRLKESLGSSLPIQQLTQKDNSTEQLPANVKQIIETTARTLAIDDYPVPKFPLGELTQNDEKIVANPPQAQADESQDNQVSSISNKETMSVITAQPKKIELKTPETIDTKANDNNVSSSSKSIEPSFISPAKAIAPEASSFTPINTQPTPPIRESSANLAMKDKTMLSTINSPVIKNQSGAGSLLRLILITLSVFVAVVAVGVGVGLGLLSLSDKNTTPVSQPNIEVEAKPTPTPTPTPETQPVDITAMKIHVVNATKKAGYAGTIKTKLITAGIKSTTAGNALGSYTTEADGLVLMEKDNADAIVALSEATGLKLEYAEGYLTEDPKSVYSAVIVLTK